VGGWVAEATKRNLIGFVVVLTLFASAMILALACGDAEFLLPVWGCWAAGHGGSAPRARDLKDASHPGRSARCRLRLLGPCRWQRHHAGSARLLIDIGHPHLVLPVWRRSWFCRCLRGSAQSERGRAAAWRRPAG